MLNSRLGTFKERFNELNDGSEKIIHHAAQKWKKKIWEVGNIKKRMWTYLRISRPLFCKAIIEKTLTFYKVHSRRLVLIEIYLISWLKDSISERCQIFSNVNKYLNVFFTELSRVDLKFKQMHKCLIMVMKILEQRKVGDKWREIAVLGNQICYKAIVIWIVWY